MLLTVVMTFFGGVIGVLMVIRLVVLMYKHHQEKKVQAPSK